MLNSTLEAYADSAFADHNGKARHAAIKGTVELSNLIPPTVSYESRGNVVIIGAEEAITTLADQFSDVNSVTLLATEKAENTQARDNLYFAANVTVSGYLGAFDVNCEVEGSLMAVNLAKVAIARSCFDLVVDLTEQGLIAVEIPAPGYYAIGAGKAKVADVIEELPAMLGTFDKPKYFRLNPDLCAHSSRGIQGCDRCVDACPAGALSSTGHSIEINPYLCQGVGTCATACPTEAITYALPDPENTQHFVHRLLTRYLSEGGEAPTLLFFGNRDEAKVAQVLPTLPTSVIPVALEELATIGIDTWFSALAYGAHQVLLATNTAYIPATIDRVLRDELTIAQTFLTEMGYEADRIALFNFADAETFTGFDAALLQNADRLEGNKREKLFAVLDALYTDAPVKPAHSALLDNAPYGGVDCKTDDCTLCMSCVAVCPTRALHAIGDRPGLLFIEQDCVQCGMCEKACPEKVITLKPGLTWDATARQNVRTVHEEEAACCTECGKAFAPASMIKMLTEKLQGHSHFQGDALRRVSMCEDCRVRDIFANVVEDPESQLKM
ncbi:4Fe-4S binding protein [Photobacterium aphoticum]|uniref:(Fe-S)-binding protein n=1 Tax=Photobacterium aphoticum TaxID=754436 RepID=A0A090QKH6_9GAMM|nr:4Fe-4S binding protein [Photobacterium aphoticum]KLV00533.1 (Fe-S)-binding protein [Photobacterium aphoticum]PSU59887.1 (Fe-S)-binding protein [Photobacterium aphoticum]GAL03650.1 iron-sulfur cluster-binding protein [Photobacterium aphoticum]GHA41545.1 formate hydrogenlyase subunit 6 [Photobacterium aphoticum]